MPERADAGVAATTTPITFDGFYRQHRARLVATLNAATKCGADAATDAVDEAFVRALAQWPRVQRMDAPAGWVFTVARNELKRTRRRRDQERKLLTSSAGGGGGGGGASGGAASGVAGAEGSWELWHAVSELPERERLAIALRYLGDFTERQVADVMGVAAGTVAATLSSARRRLNERLRERVGDEAKGGARS